MTPAHFLADALKPDVAILLAHAAVSIIASALVVQHVL